MADQQEATSKVFISYSRRNKAFVQKLNDSLDNSGVDAWVDWEGIPLSSDWMEEITRAIDAADAFLFVITPDSLASEVCADELEVGLKNNKKLVPILHIEPEKGSTMHEKLAATNWVYMREQDDYEATLPALIDTIQTDLGWVRQHTRLLQRAKEWDTKNRNNSFLLQGADLQDAEAWMVDASNQEGRGVLSLQADYILASREAATQRQRNLLIGVSLALVVSIGLAIFAMFQRSEAIAQREIAQENEHAAATARVEAEHNADLAATQQAVAEENEAEAVQNAIVAQARQAAAEARIYQSEAGKLDLSTLLAADSWQRSPSFLAEDILRRNTSLSPIPVAQVSQGGRIWRIKNSSDEKYFATASADGSVCLWEAVDATQHICVEQENAVYDVVFGAEDKTFIAGGDDGIISIWAVEDGELLQSYEFGSPIWDIDLRPDGSKLAVGRDDGVVSLIDLTDLEAPPENWTHDNTVYKVVFTPNGKALGVGTAGGRSYLWNVDNAFFIEGATHDGDIYALDFSADSLWMVSGGTDSFARASDVVQGIDRGAMRHGDWIEFIEFAPSGNWFATASDDNNLRIWDVETQVEKLRMTHRGFVLRMDISDNGAWIASTGYDQTARVWDTVSGSEMIQIPLDARGTAILFSEDNTRLFVGDDSGKLTLWDTSTLLARLNIIEFPELVREARYSPDGEYLAVNTDARDVRLFPIGATLSTHDGTEGEVIMQAEGLTYDLGFSPDSKWVAAAASRDYQAVFYNLQTQTVSQIDQGAKLDAFDFDPNNDILATAGGDGLLRFWDLNTAEEIGSLENPDGIQAVAYHPDGKTIAVSMANQIIIWDVNAKTQITTLSQAGAFHNMIYSPDGAWLAAASSASEVYLWSVDNNYALSDTLLRMNGVPYSLDFSPDGSLIAGGTTDGFAYLWDVELGEEIARLPHVDVVSGVSFSPDGTELATAARKMVQIWDIPAISRIQKSTLVETACSRLTGNMSQEEWTLIYPSEEYRLICPDLTIKE